MGDIFITDFKYGMDRTRARVAGKPGTLWLGKNVHISRGGDINRAKKFVPTYSLPPGQTFGLAALGTQLYTFGSMLSPVVPAGVQYQQLVSPDASPLTAVLDAKAADGKLYVAARFGSGNIYHFFNGARVTDWDAIADAAASYPVLANYLAELISEDPKVYAEADGARVLVKARTAGEAFTCSVTVTDGGATNDQTATASVLQANAPGVRQIVALSFGGTAEPLDRFTVVVNGNSYVTTGRAAATGRSVYVSKRRVWSTAGSALVGSALNAFSDFHTTTSSTGMVSINVSTDAEGSEPIVGVESYLDYAAVFTRRNIRIYALNTDAQLIALQQPINNVGLLAPRAVKAYGTTDVFFLDESGLRSLRARDASNAAYVEDAGTAIDPFLREHVDSLPFYKVQRAAVAIEPRDGRFMLAIGQYVFVYSYFPSTGIKAWTFYDPGLEITDFARVYSHLYARAGDTIYLYGGVDGAQYPDKDETPAEVHLPFVATSPPVKEQLTGFDAAFSNEWLVDVLLDPNNENARVRVGLLKDVTYGGLDTGMNQQCTYMAFNLKCSAAGAASISSLCVHEKQAGKNA